MSDNGLITVRCERPVRETVDRLAEVVAAAGLTVFGRVDHGGNATAVGMELPADGAADLREPAGRHAADAGSADGGD